MAAAMNEQMLTLRDGSQLAERRWTSPGHRQGTIVIVHGLGEHGGRYAQLAGDLTADGWDVHAPDLRGHGRSPGARGAIPASETIRDDILDALRSARTGAVGPVVLLGHSMGGAFAAWAIAHEPTAADALLLSSPALRTDLSSVQRFLMVTMQHIAPNLAVGNGLDANLISHNRAVVAAYTADPLVHDRVSARLARAIVTAGEAAIAAAPGWRCPTLLLYSGADRLVNASGAMAFAAAAPASVVSARRFDTLYHEIFNETGRAEPVAAALGWLRTLGR
jgi:alpha-beta hydrolase superfamily lysophospholipase